MDEQEARAPVQAPLWIRAIRSITGITVKESYEFLKSNEIEAERIVFDYYRRCAQEIHNELSGWLESMELSNAERKRLENLADQFEEYKSALKFHPEDIQLIEETYVAVREAGREPHLPEEIGVEPTAVP